MTVIDIDSHFFEPFDWYEKRFPECIGAMKKIYLSPQMTASIDQQKVSLNIIRQRKAALAGGAPSEAARRRDI